MALDGVNAVAAAAILSNSSIQAPQATAGVVVAAITPGILGLAYPFVLAQNAAAAIGTATGSASSGTATLGSGSTTTGGTTTGGGTTGGTTTGGGTATGGTTSGATPVVGAPPAPSIAAAPPAAAPPTPSGSAGSNGHQTPPPTGTPTGTPPVTYTEIPDLVSKGPTLEHASKLLAESRLTANPLYSYSIEVARDHVISQSPVAGTTAPLDSSVDVVVSAGPVPLPPADGDTQLAARVERIAEHEETLRELVRALASHEQRLVEIAKNHQAVLIQLESMQNSFERRLEKVEGSIEGRVARGQTK